MGWVVIAFIRGDDHGPMDADAIGAAAAMEAFKQTASKAPAGGFQASKASGGPSSKPGKVAQEEEEEEEEEETAAARGGSGGGMQDKLVRSARWSVAMADRDADGTCHVSCGQVV